MDATRQPVIVGVADFKNASKELRADGSDEPAALMLAAINEAIQDASPKDRQALLDAVDSVSCVRAWSWHYHDLAQHLSDKLALKNVRHRVVSPHNGSQPAKLLDEACQRIAAGTSKCALLAGGDALDSLERAMAAGEFPPPAWTPCEQDEMMQNMPQTFIDERYNVGQPVQVYAMYENAFRASKQQTFSQNHQDSVDMYAHFSEIASQHPASWNAGKVTSKETIATVDAKRNRMINTPYPMLLCAFNKVNVAAACIVTSLAFAEQCGIDRSKCIFVKGGAGTSESEKFTLRPQFDKSQAIQQSIDAALRVADIKDAKKEIALFDFYSCFPIVPKLAIDHLHLPKTQEVTLLGGLTSFGGAGNNYSMHAIAEMTRQLRQAGTKGSKQNGLILANGGVLSYQHVVVLSNEPRTQPYPRQHALGQYCDRLTDSDVDNVAPEGQASIETYTVDFGRKGDPKTAQIIGRSAKSSKRFLAHNGDEATLRQLASMTGDEIVGRKGRVYQSPDDPEKNLFSLITQEKL